MPIQVKVELLVTNIINRVINEEKETTANTETETKSSLQPIQQRKCDGLKGWKVATVIIAVFTKERKTCINKNKGKVGALKIEPCLKIEPFLLDMIFYLLQIRCQMHAVNKKLYLQLDVKQNHASVQSNKQQGWS